MIKLSMRFSLSWYRNILKAIYGAVLSEKALIFNETLGRNSQFMASRDWLRNFKGRHIILESQIHVDTYAAVEFVSEFTTKLARQFDKDLIRYDTNETGMYWNALLRRFLDL